MSLSVNLGECTNHNHCTKRLIILQAQCTDLLMNSDHKPKLGQSDLVYWVYNIGHLAYMACSSDIFTPHPNTP